MTNTAVKVTEGGLRVFRDVLTEDFISGIVIIHSNVN